MYVEAERFFECQLQAIVYAKTRQEVVAVYKAARRIFDADSLYMYNLLDACRARTEEILKENQ